MNTMSKFKRMVLALLSAIIFILPVVRIAAAKWHNLYLIDFSAYCSVSRALFSGLNPFPDHMDVLMFSFGKDVPIVYPGQMLLFALPGYLWGDAIQVAYLLLNIFIVWLLAALTLVRACDYRWRDLARSGTKQLIFAICASCFMSSWNVLQTMRLGQIPVILALCLYGLFWMPRLRFIRPFVFAVIAVSKYSLLTVFAPLLFFKGHRKLCFVAFAIFVLLSLSPVLCGNSLIDVYKGYSEAVVNLFKPEGVNHYTQTGITSCHLGFLKFGLLNQFLKLLAAVPILWLFWKERESRAIPDTALLLALSLTMLISYHSLHDYTLVFPLFLVRLFAFAKKRNWRYFGVTALFPFYLALPGRLIEWTASLIGRIPGVDKVFSLSNPVWSPYHNLFPLTAFFALALAFWSWFVYQKEKDPYLFAIQ